MAKPLMISVSGIRGIVGEGLNPDVVLQYTAAAGTLYGPGRVMVGRDSRITGEMVKHAVFSGLMSVGCDPVDLGICATPSVELAVKTSDAVGGIIITASHNPIQWNALKFLGSHGMFRQPPSQTAQRFLPARLETTHVYHQPHPARYLPPHDQPGDKLQRSQCIPPAAYQRVDPRTTHVEHHW